MTWARFDDLRSGTALRCPAPDRILVAEHPGEVVGVLAEVQRATDSGRWAFGYVAYEAAAGLDPQLAVHPSTPMGCRWSGSGSVMSRFPCLRCSRPAPTQP